MKKRLLILLCSLLLLTTLFACSAYKEHTTKYSALVGSWELNCVYKNSHAETFDPAVYTFTSDHKGTKQSGDVSTDFTVELGEGGTMTLTGTGLSAVFTYNVDTEAELLHLWESGEDAEIHYVLRSTQAVLHNTNTAE